MTIRSIPVLIALLSAAGCATKPAPSIHVTTNQAIIEQSRAEPLDLENKSQVFDTVFSSLPDRVFVYPTENYYYFKFFANHREIWGNLRLDSEDRDKGVLHFAYFEVHGRTDPYLQRSRTWYTPLGEREGVVVTKLAPLSYSVSANGKTVTFQLNDLKQEIPTGMSLRPSERFVSRNCDESAFQFVLVFDTERKTFRYLLDESVPLPDLLQPFGKDIFVGMRSGFAFYQDPEMNRKILFGVDARNVDVNNYFDGPFDQLGDNFVDTVRFQEYVTLAYPFYVGKVQGRGDFIDPQGARTGSRVLVSAYFSYNSLRELWSRAAACQRTEKAPVEVTACICRDEKDPAYRHRRAVEPHQTAPRVKK